VNFRAGYYDISVMGKLALRENVIRKVKLLNVTGSLHHLPYAAFYKTEKRVRKILNKARKATFDQEFLNGFKTVLKIQEFCRT